MIKKLFIILIIISNIFMLTGCWNAVEVDKMEIVSSIAIDKGKDGYKYNLAAEIISMDKGSSEDSESQQASKVVEASADTLFEATRKLISTTSRKLYYAHCKTVIISDELAREGIVPILDILMRFFTSRITVDLLIAKDTEAKNIIEQNSIRKSPNGIELETLLKNDQDHLSYTKKVDLFCAINELGTSGINLTIPTITIEKQDEEKSNFKVNGVAVFSKDKLVGYIDGEKTKYFLLITNRLKGGPLSLEVKDNSFISVQFLKNKTKTNYSVKDNTLVFNINTNTKVNVSEFGTNLPDDPEFNKLKSLIQNNLQRNIKELISEVQNEYGTDIFGFGKKIHESNPKLWRDYKKDWKETFKDLDVNIKTNVEIVNEGTTSKKIKSGV